MSISLLTPADTGYADEITGFNLAITHSPDLVVAARTAQDVAAAVTFARENGLPVHVQSTGHTYAPVTSGLLISTRALDDVHIDPAGRTATVGAGVRWGAVIAAAAEHGLAPVAGSSPTVGVVGLILGGELGPLARSHGFASDHLLGATVVTGAGDVLDVGPESHPDLFWALRGGKKPPAVVVQLRFRLAELRTLYGGSLMFDEPHIETALRAWAEYTRTADDRVTTSAAIIRFPDLEQLPPPLRARLVLSVRFAYPGDAGDAACGEELARPLREAAPAMADDLAELPAAEIARIHSDPPAPGPGWVRGGSLDDVDGDVIGAVLAAAGSGGRYADGLFTATELRHVGSPVTRADVPGGSAVGARAAGFTLTVVGSRPATFQQELPAAVEELLAAVAGRQSAEQNVNFIGLPRSPEHLATAWSPDVLARLAEVHARYDPAGVLP